MFNRIWLLEGHICNTSEGAKGIKVKPSGCVGCLLYQMKAHYVNLGGQKDMTQMKHFRNLLGFQVNNFKGS